MIGKWSLDLEFGLSVQKLSLFYPILLQSRLKIGAPNSKLFPKLPPSLQIIGAMGVVTNKSDIQEKLKNRGTTFMLMGSSIDHSNDVCRMLNLETKKIINSRDVVWLGKSYTNWLNNKLPSEDQG